MPLVAERCCDCCGCCCSSNWLFDSDTLACSTTKKKAMPVCMINLGTCNTVQFGFPLAIFDAALPARVIVFCQGRKFKFMQQTSTKWRASANIFEECASAEAARTVEWMQEAQVVQRVLLVRFDDCRCTSSRNGTSVWRWNNRQLIKLIIDELISQAAKPIWKTWGFWYAACIWRFKVKRIECIGDAHLKNVINK